MTVDEADAQILRARAYINRGIEINGTIYNFENTGKSCFGEETLACTTHGLLTKFGKPSLNLPLQEIIDYFEKD